MRIWESNYLGNVIRVENRINGEKLFVNNELQDEQMGMIATRARLFGELDNGEQIKVSLGGSFTIDCKIFINNKLVISQRKLRH